jgi:hypothetical protein
MLWAACLSVAAKTGKNEGRGENWCGRRRRDGTFETPLKQGFNARKGRISNTSIDRGTGKFSSQFRSEFPESANAFISRYLDRSVAEDRQVGTGN